MCKKNTFADQPWVDSPSEIIRIAIYEPYPMGLGGNFHTQKLILERLDRTKFFPVMVAPTEGAGLNKFREMGVECLVVEPPSSLNSYGGKLLSSGFFARVKSAVDLLCYNFELAGVLRKKKINLVYTNSVRAQLSIGLAAAIARIPSLLYIKGELANPLIDFVSIFSASRILFFCPQNRDDRYKLLTHLLRHKIKILRIGLDPLSIQEVKDQKKALLRKELGILNASINVAVVGQLYKPKGQHFVIEALARIVSDYPNVQVFFLGDHVIDEFKPYKADLEALVEIHGLQNNVNFTGWRHDSLAVVSLMDIVIHPSLAEGFGRAVLEAMALGKPVIASAVGGLREAILDGQNGYLVQPGNVTEIAARWCHLISNPKTRKNIGDAARQTVFSKYLIDDKIERLCEIWSEMAGR